jgi:FtsZ-binding cell division protein ZapB
MYWHQAMAQPDKADFLKAAEAKVKAHVDNKHFVQMEREELPEGTKVLASMWSMKQKRRILSREVYKWKARLNAHRGQQEHGINFLGDLLPSRQLVFYLPVPCHLHPPRLGDTTD